jgi:hypothetical protein
LLFRAASHQSGAKKVCKRPHLDAITISSVCVFLSCMTSKTPRNAPDTLLRYGVKLEDGSVEFVDAPGLRRSFGIKRSLAYDLLARGLIKGVSLRQRGALRGKRLFFVDSVRHDLHSQMGAEQDPCKKLATRREKIVAAPKNTNEGPHRRGRGAHRKEAIAA